MLCINNSSTSKIFVIDLPSYGLIGLILIALLLYISYIIIYIRNHKTKHYSSSVYIHLSQLSLLFVIISSITFLFQPYTFKNWICTIQNFSIQIFPFFLLIGFNIEFIYQWLSKTTQNSNSNHKNHCLISLSSFLIFILIILIQIAIVLIWFYHHQTRELCSNECPRTLFLCSLSLNFFLLFLFSLQTSLRYHSSTHQYDFIYLLISLLAIFITLTWIFLYLFIPLRSSFTLYMNNNFILAYGNIFFAYAFLGPLLFGQLFYQNRPYLSQPKKMTFRSLSLTKEQQRAFMAAYIKRNLTASCENLPVQITSSPKSLHQQLSPTCHSTLSVDSLCPTLASTVSHDLPTKMRPRITTDTLSSGTMTSEYLLISPSFKDNDK